MQMSGGHLLAACLDGGNSIIFTEGENVSKSRLAQMRRRSEAESGAVNRNDEWLQDGRVRVSFSIFQSED